MKQKAKYFITLVFVVVGLAVPSLFYVQAQDKTQTTTQTNTSSGITVDSKIFSEDGGLINCGRNNNLMDRSGGTTDATNPSHACTLYDLFSMFARVINFLLAVAGFFAIFQIVRAGQSMVLAMGNPESLTVAKNSLTNAVLGLALVLIAYVLVFAVVYGFLGIKDNPGNLFLDPIKYLQGANSQSGNSNSTTSTTQTTTIGGTTKDNGFDTPINPNIVADGSGEGAGSELAANIAPAANADVCLIRDAFFDRQNKILSIFSIKRAEAITACKEVSLGKGGLFPYLMRQQDYSADYAGCKIMGDVPSGGCGPTALAMALWAREKQVGGMKINPAWYKYATNNGTDPTRVFAPDMVADLTARTGGRGCFANGEPNGSTNNFANGVLQYYGYWSFVTSSESQIDFALEHSNYVIARMKKNSRFTNGGHFVLVWGKIDDYGGTGQKWYRIADPNKNVDVRLARSTIFYQDLNDAQVVVFNDVN